MDDADLTPQRPPLGPDEQPVADAVRRALAGRAPAPGLLARVQRRATRRHRRRVAGGAAASALALAGLVAVVPLDGLVVRGGSDSAGAGAESAAAGGGGGLADEGSPDSAASDPSAAAPDSSTGLPELSAASLLTLEQLSDLAPGARAGEVPAMVTRQEVPSPSVVGGLCGGEVLDVPPAEQMWTASWGQDALASTGPVVSVIEQLRRWDGAEDAAAYTRASSVTPTTCGDPGEPPALRVTYQLLDPPDVSQAAPSLLAVAPARGAERGWHVRSVQTDRETVVDLTVVVVAGTAEEAGARALEVAALAADQVRAADEAAP